MHRQLRAALGLIIMAAGIAAHAQALPPAQDQALMQRAFDYSFPLQAMGQLRLARLGDGSKPGPASLTELTHMRRLSGPADRWVTAPNNDTLYSFAWLDLANGPVRLTMPDTQGRYDSVALIDAYTDNISILGRRETGTRAGEFLVVGPHWDGPLPEGSRVIRASTDDVVVLVRLLVDGEPDLAAARALQDGFKLAPLDAGTSRPLWKSLAGPQASPAERYLSLVNEMIERDPPPAYERSLLEAFAPIGICGARCSWAALSPDLQARWNEALPRMLQQLKSHARMGERLPSGWTQVRPTIGRFGTDYAFRAEVALAGLLALEPAEAIYPTVSVDQHHEPFDGSRRYHLHLPAGGVPVDAFWSLTMYQLEEDGRLFLSENPIQRYSIGDRTPGLQRNADGSIDLWIQRDAPAAAKRPNWLPAAAGRFVLMMRAYQPRAEFRDQRFELEAVERLD